MPIANVLIAGEWRASAGRKRFRAVNPATREETGDEFPVSPWDEIEHALHAAEAAFETVREWPGERFAAFLESFATRIEMHGTTLIELASQETGLPVEPRLKSVELPRTVNQLRQAAAAAREGSWREATIDTRANIRSMLAGIGPVAVFGPNNFPFAFNSLAGGDFAAAVAAGNPVIGKGHPSHPATTRLFGELAHQSARETGMPSGFVQLIYRTSHEDGANLVSHPAIGATGYTGSRSAGLALKQAADSAGKPIYLELSSINPVVILPGALRERGAALSQEFASSCLMGAGQFCTNPGLVLLLAGRESDAFISETADKFAAAPVGTLLSEAVERQLRDGISKLRKSGADVVAGAQQKDDKRFSHPNTLLKVDAERFTAHPHELQTEAFGNASLVVVAKDADELVRALDQLEGNLTGSIYSDTRGSDDAAYERVAAVLRPRVGRLLNDKMPTGVAVSAAMNHGGPYPATGHPGFTAVGIPTALRRFAVLQCFDNVRPQRLPPILQDIAQNPPAWRRIDGRWTQAGVPG